MRWMWLHHLYLSTPSMGDQRHGDLPENHRLIEFMLKVGGNVERENASFLEKLSYPGSNWSWHNGMWGVRMWQHLKSLRPSPGPAQLLSLLLTSVMEVGKNYCRCSPRSRDAGSHLAMESGSDFLKVAILSSKEILHRNSNISSSSWHRAVCSAHHWGE